MWIGVQFQRAMLPLHDNRRGGLLLLQLTRRPPLSVCESASSLCPATNKGEKPHEPTQLEMAGSIQGECLAFLATFLSRVSKESTSYFPSCFWREREMLTLFTFFIVCITSFLNERIIAKWLLWASCFPACLDCFLVTRRGVKSCLKAEFGSVSSL